MSLKDKINDELKAAMKSGDKTRLTTIRSVRALILEFEKSGVNREMTEDDEMKIILSSVKKRKESIEQYEAAGRNDLADIEKAELAILSEFMPKQLDENEIKDAVKRIANEIGASIKADFPKLMPAVMKELKGKADGKVIRAEVERFLGE